jgi:glucosylceramidase
MQSETECGNNTWEAAYNPNKAPNDFGYGAYTWRKFKDFIAAGSSSYMLWNIVLDEVAKNLDGWPQNSAIVIERATKTVTYTPMFWVTKHFSALVEPGAHLAQSSGGYGDRIAFVNPDGTAIVELLNDGTTQKDLKVAVGTRTFAVSLPPKSFATLVVPP